MSRDPYVYPGTQTLRNNYDIRDPDRLEQAERMVSSAAARAPLTPPAEMTPEGLQRIHRHLFGRIYPWAGEFRTVNLEKLVTPNKTVAFERGPLVKPNIHRLFGELREDNYLRGLDRRTFAYRAAVYMEDLNFIHPFREGNGRTARLFLEHLAQQAGHSLDLTKIDPRGWLEGSIQSYRQPIDGAHDIMTRTIEQALGEPHRRGAQRGAGDTQSPAKDEAIARALQNVRRKEEGEAKLARDSDERTR